MSTLESLLAGLPGDPLTAFVVADFLEEQGDPRAEVLRLVYALTRAVKVRGRTRKEKRLRELLHERKVPPIAPTLELPLSDSVSMRLAWIPPGTFRMGSPPDESGVSDAEQPAHPVTLTRGFWMGVHLVTQAQWRAVAGADPSHANQGDAFPVDDVSWKMADDFCARATKRTGRTVRLPTEAEWEYACRAGTSTPYHFGEVVTPELARYETHPPGPHGTAEVGSFPPNGFGLHDVHGNLYEWVRDRYDRGYYRVSPEVDPQGPDGGQGDHRLLRGGSWYYGSNSCRSAFRIECSVEYAHFDQGFRVVCERQP